MSKSRHTEAQVIGVLKQWDAGRKADEVAREAGVSKHTIYAWKAKYGGMTWTKKRCSRWSEKTAGARSAEGSNSTHLTPDATPTQHLFLARVPALAPPTQLNSNSAPTQLNSTARAKRARPARQINTSESRCQRQFQISSARAKAGQIKCVHVSIVYIYTRLPFDPCILRPVISKIQPSTIGGGPSNEPFSWHPCWIREKRLGEEVLARKTCIGQPDQSISLHLVFLQHIFAGDHAFQD